MARDNPETNSVTIKPETASHVAEYFSWPALSCCSLPRHLFPKKPFALPVKKEKKKKRNQIPYSYLFVKNGSHSYLLETVQYHSNICMEISTLPRTNSLN